MRDRLAEIEQENTRLGALHCADCYYSQRWLIEEVKRLRQILLIVLGGSRL